MSGVAESAPIDRRAAWIGSLRRSWLISVWCPWAWDSMGLRLVGLGEVAWDLNPRGRRPALQGGGQNVPDAVDPFEVLGLHEDGAEGGEVVGLSRRMVAVEIWEEGDGEFGEG